MKTPRKSLIVVTVVVALALTAVFVTAALAIASPVWARAEITPFSGTIYFQDALDEGETKTSDSMEINRGAILLYKDEMDDERISGWETVVVNYVVDLVEDPEVWATGPMWGTSQIANEGGYWDVAWSGVRDEKGWAKLDCVAYGRAGYEGLKAYFTGVRESPDALGPFDYSGYILEPGAQ